MATLKETSITGNLTMGGAIVFSSTNMNIGNSNTNSAGGYSIVFGSSNTVSANYSLAVGISNNISSTYSTAIGRSNTVKHSRSIVIGNEVTTTAANSISLATTKISSTAHCGFFSKSAYVPSVANGSSKSKSTGITLPASCGGLIHAYNASTGGIYTIPFAKINDTINVTGGAYSSNHNLYWTSSSNLIKVYSGLSGGKGNYYITIWYTPGP